MFQIFDSFCMILRRCVREFPKGKQKEVDGLLTEIEDIVDGLVALRCGDAIPRW